MNKLSLVGMQLPEKYKSEFRRFKRRPFVWSNSRQRETRLQSGALFDEISGAQMLENRSAGAQNSSQVRTKMQSREQK
jgi:hypothetical protein